MNEKEIMEGNIKLVVFDTFDFKELAEIVKLIEGRGYTSTLVSNGNIVLQKINDMPMTKDIDRPIDDNGNLLD